MTELPPVASMTHLQSLCQVKRNRSATRARHDRVEKAVKQIFGGLPPSEWLTAIRAEQQRRPKYGNLSTTKPGTSKSTKGANRRPSSTTTTKRYSVPSSTSSQAASNYARALARAKSKLKNSTTSSKPTPPKSSSTKASTLTSSSPASSSLATSIPNSQHAANRISLIRAQLTKATQRAQAESLARSKALQQQAALRKQKSMKAAAAKQRKPPA